MIDQNQPLSPHNVITPLAPPGSRRWLSLLRVALVIVNVALLGFFVQNLVAHANGSASTCAMTTRQLPTGPSSPLTAKNDDRHFGHPLTLPWLQGQAMTVSGSSALYPLIADGAATFNDINKTHIDVAPPSNSTQGLLDIMQGKSQVALSDVFVDDVAGVTSGQLYDYIVAVVPFTLIANADLQNTVHNLSRDQIKSIYAGSITNWHDVGGPDEHITVINRPEGSGTRISLQRYLLGGSAITAGANAIAQSTQDLVQQVHNTHGALGYAATSDLVTLPAEQLSRIFPLCIDGFGATTVNIADGDYPFWNVEHLYTKDPYPYALSIEQTFFGFVCGGDFQAKDVLTYGFLHPTQLASDVLATHVPTQTPHEIRNKCAI